MAHGRILIDIAYMLRVCENEKVKSYCVSHWEKIKAAAPQQGIFILDAIVKEDLRVLKEIIKIVK